MLDARDADFAQFGVWQDANQNGACDAGEFKSLADAGIASIDLTGNGQAGHPALLAQEAGQTTATLTDGSTMQAADTAFIGVADTAPLWLTEQIDGVALPALAVVGPDQRLDFSALAHGEVDLIDMGGHGQQTLRLTLADVLQSGTGLFSADGGWVGLDGNGKHQLLIRGDAADTVQVDDASAWQHLGSTSHAGQVYEVYENAGHTAQLLLQASLTRSGAVL